MNVSEEFSSVPMSNGNKNSTIQLLAGARKCTDGEAAICEENVKKQHRKFFGNLIEQPRSECVFPVWQMGADHLRHTPGE